jgi:DNA-binding transcriptional LysR family regulator
MHLASLKVFCDVVRHRSFSQAAQANDITQSAASQIVSQLESEKNLNVQLIDRSTRPLTLTPLGQTFYEGAKALLEQYRELESSIHNAQAQIAGTVQVAAIYSVGLGDMGQYVSRFQEFEPGSQVHLEYLHPDRVYEKVLDGTADLGLVSFPRPSPKLAVLPWRNEDMVLACSPRHRLAQNLALQLRDLTGQKYIHFDKNLAVRRQIDKFLRDQGVTVEVVHEFDNIENIKQAVVVGAGVALLPEPTLRREVKARTLVAVPLFGCKFSRPFGIIHRRRHKLSHTAQRFIELLREQEAGVSPEVNGTAAVGKPGAYAPHANGRNGAPLTSKRT